MFCFGNVVTAMVTPFSEDGSLDLESARNLARYLESHGTDVILLSGTTGESPTLALEEQLRLLEAVKETVSIPVMLGTGCNDTRESVEASVAAEKGGADALLLVVPYYNKPNHRGLVEHFSVIAGSVGIPCMVYDIPSRTGIKMAVQTITELSRVENIAALKAASGDLDQIVRARMEADPSLQIYSGDDISTLPILSVGGVGVVSVASNVIGSQIQEMVRLFHEARIEESRKLFFSMYPFYKALFTDTNPIPVKYAVSLLGLVKESYRLPMTPPAPETKALVCGLMEEAGLI